MRGNGWSRGAEEFDALVSGRDASHAETHGDLLELVAALRAVPVPEARPEFVSSLRTQLIAAAEREPARVEDALAARLTPRQRRGSRERRLAALVGGFAVVSATGSMAMASQSALPGDVLYPVKRAIENAQTNLQPSGAAKASALISHAESRLDEVQRLTARGADADAISAALQDFTDQARAASELALDDYTVTRKPEGVADLRAFAADSMDILGGLGSVVPTDSRAILITATQTIRQIDLAASQVCPTCAGGDVAEIPDFATQPLSAVLSGDVPGTATDTEPAPEAEKTASPQVPPTAPATTPPATSTESPVEAAPVETGKKLPKATGVTKGVKGVGKTVEGVTRGLTGALGIDGSSQTVEDGETPPSLTGTLIDGVNGVIGGLLGTNQGQQSQQ